MNKELIKKMKELKDLEAAGLPQEGWVLSARERLMAQVKPLAKENVKTAEPNYYWQYIKHWTSARALKPVVAIVVMVMMMIGYNATITLADASLPGDTLYHIKTASEKVQLAFTFKDNEKVDLQMSFVARRVDELNKIIEKKDDTVTKAVRVATAAKKISKDVKSVKDGLNNIRAASADSVLAVAKNIDDKTLEASQALVALPDKIKKAAGNEISDAILNVGEAGNVALGVIVKEYEDGSKEITGKELTTRVAKRIKNTEETIANVASGAQDLVSKEKKEPSDFSGNVIRDGLAKDNLANETITSTLQVIVDKSQEAKNAIEEAKDLLDNENFSLAIEKIKQGQSFVLDASGNVSDLTEKDGQVQGESEVATTTKNEAEKVATTTKNEAEKVATTTKETNEPLH